MRSGIADGTALMSTADLSRRSLLACGLAALVTDLASAHGTAATMREMARSVPDVRRFGARGDGFHDDTAAFAEALRRASTILVSAGTYLVTSIAVPAGRQIFTEGFSTILRQRPGLRSDTRLLNIAGSNVRIGDIALEGNIATDAGEQRHGLFIQANSVTGDLSNIEIGNVMGTDLRGDLVYIGAGDHRSVGNIRTGDITGDNIFRNVVSICGGDSIAVGRIAGSRVGHLHLDVEPDIWNGPVGRLSVDALKGGFVQIAGQTRMSAVGQVAIGTLDLEGTAAGSVPAYARGGRRLDALTIRNLRSLRIKRLVAKGFAGHAVRQVYLPGELSDQSINITEAELSDCCTDSRQPPSYIEGDRRTTRLLIDRLLVDIGRPEISAIADCKEAIVRRARGRIPAHGRLIRNSNKASLVEILTRNAPSTLLAAARLAADSEVGAV